MKKTLMTLLPFVALLTLSAEAKVLPIQSYNILTQQFSMLNTCRAEGYIVDTAVLKRLDKLIKRFEYQDASGTTTRITGNGAGISQSSGYGHNECTNAWSAGSGLHCMQ